MQRHPDYTRERLRQLADRLRDRIYPDVRPIHSLRVSGPTGRISFAEAQRLSEWRPAELGDQFGPLFATFWFRAEAEVPPEWNGRRVDLLWISHSEATLWLDGRSVQGLNGEGGEPFGYHTRQDAILSRRASAGRKLSFQIEISCNKLWGAWADTAGPFKHVSPYVLDRADIALFDQEAWDLYHDFLVLQELDADGAKHSDLDPAWNGLLLSELNRFANAWDADDRATWRPARAILAPLLAKRNGSVTHESSALGHGHIDTAWLWPLAETDRKCTRTFSSACTYMEDYPEYKFSVSQAYQLDRIRQINPDLFDRIKQRAAEGQFVPVGATWVEPDCNIPSGESLIRQFLHGQRFFQEHFGRRCNEFWNVDVFGYCGQLPQILRGCGINRFVTTKLSWNKFNKPQHHTFTWEGIDGSEILTHFPPADSYGVDANVGDLRRSSRQHKDHDRTREGLLVFGFGDGGGGPNKRMLETLRRCRDLQGVPRTEQRTLDDFFERLEADCTDRPRIVGELYFEYHRGTYTTQAKTKKGNRKVEVALHDAECLAALASLDGHAYPSAKLDELWKLLLLNQFHDILPGSSIAQVHEESERDLARVQAEAAPLAEAAARVLVGEGAEAAVLNTTGFARREVVRSDDGTIVFAEAPPYGVGILANPDDEVVCRRDGDHVLLENRHLRATLHVGGDVLSLIEKTTGRESLTAPGNRLVLFEDRPTQFDAWDIDPFHLEKPEPCPPAEACEIVEASPLATAIEFRRSIGRVSRMTQTVRLTAESRYLVFDTHVDWQEEHRVLKAGFEVSPCADRATYEMQFGVAERPTHYNTSFDLARFEVPGHRFADLSEPGFGVALLTDCKYGYSTYASHMRVTLLRAPTSPDPQADRGEHTFSYAIFPHAGDWREGGVVAEATRFNVPLRLVERSRGAELRSYLEIDRGNIVIDTVKQAEVGNDLIVRLYEAHGTATKASLQLQFPFRNVTQVNLMEEQDQAADVEGDAVRLAFTPFQIVTLRVRREDGKA